MKADLLSVIDTFAGRPVLVIGEAMLDSYLEGTTHRLCREAPVPVVDIAQRIDLPGGAANTAVNVAALGGQVTFLSAVGDDPEGAILRQALEARGVSTQPLLVRPGRSTPAKHRVVAAGQILVRYDQGSTAPDDPALEELLIARLAQDYPHYAAVIVSDYGYGILTPRVITVLADLQTRTPHPLVVDAKHLPAYRHAGVTAVKPNYEEALRLLDLAPADDRAAQMAAQGARLLEQTGAQIVALTLDTDGGLIFERDRLPYRLYAQPSPHSRAAGAGDTFVGALTLALAAGAPTPSAAELAATAAAVVVAKDGTATCAAAELRLAVAGHDCTIPNLRWLARQAEAYRRQGRRIVLTNGCFDLLHRGHIAFLNQARALGDLLIVGVNSDASVRRLKGPGRPINPLDDRVQVLAALSCVDHIIAFDADQPHALIRAVRPDVFAKGGNYMRAGLPEADLVEALGGRVAILPYSEDHSTAAILRRTHAAAPRPIRVPAEVNREPVDGAGAGPRGNGFYHETTGAA